MIVPYDLLYVFIISLCLGSFSGMLVYRLNNNIPVFKRSRSYCPSCDHELQWYNNIPLFSFIFQKGKCSFCEKSISWHYFIIELTTASLLTFVYYWYNIPNTYIESHNLYQTFVVMIFVYLLIICASTDLMTGYIFDKVTITGIVLGFVLSVFSSSLGPLESSIGAIAGFLTLWVIGYVFYALKGIDGIGGGDMKMLAMIGIFMGFQSLAYVLMFASIASLIFSAVLMSLSNDENKRLIEFKFGQYLAFAAIFLVFVDYRFLISLM